LDESSLYNVDMWRRLLYTLDNAKNTPETTLLAGSLHLLAMSIFDFLGSAAHQ